MKSPFFKIYITETKEDISEFISSFRYTRALKEDDILELKVERNKAWELGDREDIQKGIPIYFQYGYLGGKISAVRKAKLADIDCDYGSGLGITLRCVDQGSSIKKSSPPKIWKNVTATEICKEIANKYGLQYKVEDTEHKYDNYPQGGKSDFEFLNMLARKESDGNYVFYVQGDTLYFIKKKLDSNSKVTYSYGDGTTVVSFKPKSRETTQSASKASTSVTGFDPMNKKALGMYIGDGDEKKETKLDDKYHRYSGVDASKVNLTLDRDKKTTEKKDNNGSILDGAMTFGKSIVAPIHNQKELENVANSQKKRGNESGEEATLKIEGDPLLEENTVITMDKVLKRHKGNWFINKITDDITGNVYYTDLDLSRNSDKTGTSKIGGETKSNKSIGGNKTDKKKEVGYKVYGNNAQDVTDAKILEDRKQRFS